MRLRTFHASDMQTAMQQIRDELGESAVIVSTTRDEKTKRVSVTAAIDQTEVKLANETPMHAALVGGSSNASSTAGMPSATATAASRPDPEISLVRSNSIMTALEKVLNFHSVPEELQEELLNTAKMLDFEPQGGDAALTKLLAKTLESHFRFLPLPVSRAGFRLMLVGPTGAGKTTTLAKIAAQLRMEDLPITTITFDTKRAGGIEQFRAFTDILEIELEVAETEDDLRDILDSLPADHVVLIDSFGCNPYNPSDLKDLRPFLQIPGIEPVLTLPAGGDAAEAAELGKAFEITGTKRLLMTRCDISRRFGGALAAAHIGNYAFCNYSSSDRVVGEYGPLGTKTLSNLLMRYRTLNGRK